MSDSDETFVSDSDETRVSDSADIHTGACLCGAVRYTISGKLIPLTVCHCKQCQRWTGDRFPATRAAKDRIDLSDPDEAISWYRSGEGSRRGFCRVCGSSLFYENEVEGYIAVIAGTLDDTADLEIEHHIFTADRSGFDALPRDVGFPQDQPKSTKRY